MGSDNGSPSKSKGVVPEEGQILFYTTPDGEIKLDVLFSGETVWLTQKKMAELFDVDVRTINEHLVNIFRTGELIEDETIRKFRIVQKEGTRDVTRVVNFYNLDAIISVGYRVNSGKATQFRIWATKTLREFIIKGFVLDDDRLKNGRHFGIIKEVLPNMVVSTGFAVLSPKEKQVNPDYLYYYLTQDESGGG